MAYKDLIKNWEYSGQLSDAEETCFKVSLAFRKHFAKASEQPDFQMHFIEEYLQTSRFFFEQADKAYWFIFEQTACLCLSDLGEGVLLKTIWEIHNDIFNGFLHKNGSWDNIVVRYNDIMTNITAITDLNLQKAYESLMEYLMNVMDWLGR